MPSKESRLWRITLIGCGREGSVGADGVNMISSISGEDIPEECGFDTAGLLSSVDRRDSSDLREYGDEGTCKERGRSLPIGRRPGREGPLWRWLDVPESVKTRFISNMLRPFLDRLVAEVGV